MLPRLRDPAQNQRPILKSFAPPPQNAVPLSAALGCPHRDREHVGSCLPELADLENELQESGYRY